MWTGAPCWGNWYNGPADVSLPTQKLKAAQKQASLRRAELALLQAQINPHFPYNTMDTIIWLIEADRPQAAGETPEKHRYMEERAFTAGGLTEELIQQREY